MTFLGILLGILAVIVFFLIVSILTDSSQNKKFLEQLDVIRNRLDAASTAIANTNKMMNAIDKSLKEHGGWAAKIDKAMADTQVRLDSLETVLVKATEDIKILDVKQLRLRKNSEPKTINLNLTAPVSVQMVKKGRGKASLLDRAMVPRTQQ